jgi:hypothetical protein
VPVELTPFPGFLAAVGYENRNDSLKSACPRESKGLGLAAQRSREDAQILRCSRHGPSQCFRGWLAKTVTRVTLLLDRSARIRLTASAKATADVRYGSQLVADT